MRSPADLSRSWTGRFRVDPTTVESVVPSTLLRGVGVKPRFHGVYALGDGHRQQLGVAGVELELLGAFTAGMALFGSNNTEPLLGRLALNSAGFQVDVDTGTITQLRSLTLKPMEHHLAAPRFPTTASCGRTTMAAMPADAAETFS